MHITVFSTSRGKTFFFSFLSFFLFAWRFILNEKHFVLIDHILSKTICFFCFCVLFSNIYPKIKFLAKDWSGLCNFYNKVVFFLFFLFLEFLSKKICLLFFAEFELPMFLSNIVKILEKWNKQNLLKTA